MKLATLTPKTPEISAYDRPTPRSIAKKLVNHLPPAPRAWNVEPSREHPKLFKIRVNNRLLPENFVSPDEAETTFDHLWALT